MDTPPRELRALTPDKVVRFRSPRSREEQTELFAMGVFLCMWGIFFLGLVMAFLVVRSSAPRWPPPGVPPLPTGLAALALPLLLGSSALLHLGVVRLREGRRARSVQALVGTLALGGVFLALQAGIWTVAAARGLTLETGGFAELYYLFTAFHALQLGFGEAVMLLVLTRVWRGLWSAARLQPVRLWALYWHAAVGVGCVAFLLLYLV